MPKRECPFEYDLLPQCKVHIGEKEVNSGVLHEVNMKTVYEKTVEKLFRGAKSCMIPPPLYRKECASQTDCKMYKQMFLKTNCQLQTSGVLLSQPLCECDVCKESLKLCASTTCDFCDRRLCSSCIYKCIKCADKFCTNCVLKTYVGSEDSQVCISCVH